jgi:hypothetical protein
LGWGLAFTLLVRPALGQTTLGTGFSYQGLLKSSGTAVTGLCDFQFSLFDALSTGNQKGSTQTVQNVSVTSGLFTTTVNPNNEFGSSGFIGQARWLEIGVRCPAGSGVYTPLLPRTALGVTPFASYPRSTSLVAYGNVAGSINNAASYTAFGSAPAVTVPASGQYVIHFGATLAAGSTSIQGGNACVTIAFDADPAGGGACLGQNTGGATITTHDSEMMVYYLAAGAHTLHFYGIAVNGSAVSGPWFFVLRP